jgi:hypothetical protein
LLTFKDQSHEHFITARVQASANAIIEPTSSFAALMITYLHDPKIGRMYGIHQELSRNSSAQLFFLF